MIELFERTAILRGCARAWGVSVQDILGFERDQPKTHARFAACLLLKERFNHLGAAALGRLVGGRETTAIGNALDRASGLAAYNADFAMRLGRVRTALAEHRPVEAIAVKPQRAVTLSINDAWTEETTLRRVLAESERKLLAAVQAAHPERLQMQEAAE